MTFHCDISEFLVKRKQFPVFDVRTEAEFLQGHIPGALNLPLFSVEERHIIGLTYKTEGKQAAILKGLDFVGPKMRPIIEQVKSVTDSRVVLAHCWRGGMRSGAVGWLLGFYGFTVYIVNGGYKAYRRHILEEFKTQKSLVILGGRTGSGKTDVLRLLPERNQQIIDLELLANHKGSAFGDIDQPAQPTQEQFDNDLGLDWVSVNPEKVVWLEDESHKTGSIQINEFFWPKMRTAPVIYLDIPVQERAKKLVEEYGKTDPVNLEKSILKIREKLGGTDTKQCLLWLETGDWLTLSEFLLTRYYDPGYDFGTSKRDPESIIRVPCEKIDPAGNADRVVEALGRLKA